MQDGGSSVQNAVASDPAWFSEDYDPAKGAFAFVRTDRETLARQTFLDHRWDKSALPRQNISVAALGRNIESTAQPPQLNFIWHTSFCCSTLIAELLDQPGRNLSLREPLVLVQVADAKRANLSGQPVPPRLFDLTFRLLGRRFEESSQITIKPSNFANILIRDAARLTRGKALFLYSDLESFLISVAKGGVQLRQYVRRLFGNIAGDCGEKLPWSPQEMFQMSDLQIAAIAWHLQIVEFERSFSALGAGRAASLDCDAFLAEPHAVLVKLDAFFGLGLGDDHLASLAAGPSLKRHAKQTQHAFDAERRREETEAVRRFLGEDLQRIVAWSYAACPGTPRGVPVLGALVPAGKSYTA